MSRSRDRIFSTSLLTALLLAAPAGCSPPPDEAPAGEDFVVERTTTEDGVPVVRTVSGSAWGAPGRLVEETVIGGPEATEDEYIFGNVAGVWSTPERIYALDYSVPIVRVFDTSGSHLHDIGRGGQGPGEFTQPAGLALDADGRLLVADAEQHRVIRFASDGAHIDTWTWTSTGVTFASPSLIPAPDGLAWVVSFELPDRTDFDSFRVGYLLVGPEGAEPIRTQPEVPDHEPVAITVETSSGTRTFDWIVPFAPREIHGMDRHGTWYMGNGAGYRIHVRGSEGSRRIIERSWDPVEVRPEEAAARLARAEARVRRMTNRPHWRWNGPDVPPTKPAFTAIAADYDDRIWVQRPGSGIPIEGCVLEEVVDDVSESPCWTQERFWDVFDPDGEFLGEVPVPTGAPDITRVHIQDDRVTLSRPDPIGNPQIVRYRLEIPPRSGTRDS